ncbi:MAG: hypothetical protein ACE5JX_15820 [Acidobacteriota bacterium]
MNRSKSFVLLGLVIVLAFFAIPAAAQDTNTGRAATFRGTLDIPPPTQGSSVVFDLSPGTSAPPPTLGGFTMTPVPPGAPACTGILPPLPVPSGGSIGISPTDGAQRCIGAGWATWSHGYLGDVYYTGGPTSQTLTLPAGTQAVYFYIEPNPFSVQTFTAQAFGTSGSASSGAFQADGNGGAVYVGVFVTDGSELTRIEISGSTDFAVGEFAWAGGEAGNPLGGEMVGGVVIEIFCFNKTQGTAVHFFVPAEARWDCTAAGLPPAEPRDNIVMLVVGRAQ